MSKKIVKKQTVAKQKPFSKNVVAKQLVATKKVSAPVVASRPVEPVVESPTSSDPVEERKAFLASIRGSQQELTARCRYCGKPVPKPLPGAVYFPVCGDCVGTGEPIYDRYGKRIN